MPLIWEKNAVKEVTFNYVAENVTGIAITDAPTKTTYKAGEAFDPTGMKVTVTYDGGRTEVITSGWTLTPDGTSATANSLASDTTKVTVGYGGQTADQTVTIDAVNSIAVKTPPTKTSYKKGTDFDATGMVITVTYDSGDTVDITSGWTLSDNTNLQASGNVTITYAGETATQAITVATVTSISIATQPTKTTYTAGEDFEDAGMTIAVVYSDANFNETITSGWTVTGGTGLTAGTTTITVNYEGQTATVNITVA